MYSYAVHYVLETICSHLIFQWSAYALPISIRSVALAACAIWMCILGITPIHSSLRYETNKPAKKKRDRKNCNSNCSNSYIIVRSVCMSWRLETCDSLLTNHLQCHFLFMYFLMHCCWFWSFAPHTVQSAHRPMTGPMCASIGADAGVDVGVFLCFCNSTLVSSQVRNEYHPYSPV